MNRTAALRVTTPAMAQTRAPREAWRYELRYRGALRHEGTGPTIAIGESGELVVPGLGGAHVLASGSRVHAVAGLTGVVIVDGVERGLPNEGALLRAGDRAVLRPVDHPEIEIAIERAVRERIAISRAPAIPWREAVYGLTFAACVCAFIGVKVAASPLKQKKTQDDRDRELVHAWLDDVPIAVVRPLPVVEVQPLEPPEPANTGTPESAGDEGLDDARIETPEVASNAEVDEAAPAKPKKLRRRQRDDDARMMDIITSVERGGGSELVAILGTSEVASLSAIADAPIDDEVYGGLLIGGVGIAADEVTPAPVDGVPGGVAGGVPGGAVPPQMLPVDVEHADADVEGIAATPSCDLEFDPKPRLDVVFVVDATRPMSETLDTLARQVGALQARAEGARPRYGLVAFADDVEFSRLDALTATELRVAIAGLAADARARVDEPDARDDVLGALERAREFPWGEGRETLRMIVLVTDADYADKGETLGEHTVVHSHDRVAKRLAADSIRVVSMTHHPVPGLDRGRRGRTSLPEATAGLALDDDVLHGAEGLADALGDLLRNPVCKTTVLETIIE